MADPPKAAASLSRLSPTNSLRGTSSELSEATEGETLGDVPDSFDADLVDSETLENVPALSGLLAAGKNGKALAAFVAKLYSMLEDNKVQNMIHWNNSGGFVVENPDEFAREVLPQYFKHNNFASFVRQLNMYGFHKVNDFVQQNSDQQHWEFSHPSFQKGKRDLLFDIKRKVSSAKFGTKAKMDNQQEFVEDMTERVEKLEGEISKLQQSNSSISNELMACKQFIKEQRLAINQIIQYLGPNGAVDVSSSEEGTSKKRRIDEAGADQANGKAGVEGSGAPKLE